LTSLSNDRAGREFFKEIVVVDNSPDQELKFDQAMWPFEVRFIENRQNVGFARACNQGAEGAACEYLLFLNPDTEVFEGAISQAVEFMDSAAAAEMRIGICGVQTIGDDGTTIPSCARFPSPRRIANISTGLARLLPQKFPSLLMTDWPHNSSAVVDQVAGAFFLVRTHLFRTLGGFDEDFFVYFEEVDFCYRAYQRGWRTYFLHGPNIYHKGGGASSNALPERLFYSLRSRLLYFAKHYPPQSLAVVALLTIIVEPLIRIASAAMPGSSVRIPTIASAMRQLLEWIVRGGGFAQIVGLNRARKA
jgi:hypothetical protein